MKQVTKEQWARAKRMGYAEWRDTRPYLLYMDTDGATVWGQVEIVTPLIDRDRRAEQAAAEAYHCSDCGHEGFSGWNCQNCGSTRIR